MTLFKSHRANRLSRKANVRIHRVKQLLSFVLHFPAYIEKIILLLRDLNYHLELVQNILEQKYDKPHMLLESEASLFSQNGENGILYKIFSILNDQQIFFHRTCLEIGVGNGSENNTVNLLFSGWQTHWIEGNPHNAQKIAEHFNSFKSLYLYPEMATSQNLDRLSYKIDANLNPKTLSLLIVDIDSIDAEVTKYFCGKYAPIVIVVEINASLNGSLYDFSLDPDYSNYDYNEGHTGYGASLDSFIRYLSSDYKYIYTERCGINSFFIRNDVYVQIQDIIPPPLVKHHSNPRYHQGNFDPKAGHKFNLPKPNQLNFNDCL